MRRGVRRPAPLLSIGRPASAPVEQRRLRQTVKEPGPRWVDACGGSGWRCKKEWGGETTTAGNEKRPGTIWLPGLCWRDREGERLTQVSALQPPPGGGAVSSKPLPSHCGWLLRPLPCKYEAWCCCDGSRFARDGMDEVHAINAPRTATAPWRERWRMAVRQAFTVVFRRSGGDSVVNSQRTGCPDGNGL